MTNSLNGLADVLAEEVAVGEALCRNIEAQKNALVAWNITELLAQIEAREPWLRSLGELEQRRCRIVEQSGVKSDRPILRQVIEKLPTGAPERALLMRLREQARQVFSRVQADELHLNGLMAQIVGLMQEALSPLVQTAAPTYGETGAAERQRPASALLQSKA